MAEGTRSHNVKVAVRSRPLSAKEMEEGYENVVTVSDDGKSTTIQTNRGPKTFTYDHSYDIHSSQEAVYADLGRPLVKKAMTGYNGTVFAYGQTGSGKTHTMMGLEDSPGIIPQLQGDLFEAIDEAQSDSKQFLVLVSYLEIYNEVIKDLLNPSVKQLKIREHPSRGIYVEHLAELVVTNSEEVTRYLDQGNAVRRVAATQMNERSSRSHSCFIIRIEQKITEQIGDIQRETNLFAKINLVDLAGSERVSKTGATGDRLREGAAINKSLSALANVINSLSSKKKHIPYRDSKLTRLLQQSLGGNSVTCMIATISPASYNADETLSTLMYANRAKSIKNETHRNENVQERIIRELRETIDKLKAELARARGGAGQGDGGTDDSKKEEMAEMIKALEQAQTDTWAEKNRLSKMYEEERAKNLANTNKIRAVMQSMKEENVELLKRVKELQSEKNQLTRVYKQKRQHYMETRELLSADTRRYAELAKSADRNPRELQQLLDRVSRHKSQMEETRVQMKTTKDAIKANEEKQTEERASAAMQRKLLVEDAELRQAIQEDERAKMELEKAVFLRKALEEERERLREDTERERKAIMEKYATAEQQTESGKREQALELALVQANEDRLMMRLECEEAKAQHKAKLGEQERRFKRHSREEKVKTLAMFREFCEGFESDRKQMQSKLNQVTECLRQAVADIVFLRNRNKLLEEQVHSLAKWEPST